VNFIRLNELALSHPQIRDSVSYLSVFIACYLQLRHHRHYN